MKPEWTDYPLGLYLAAVRSTAGGILTLMIALCFGTQIGYLTLNGHFDFPDDVFDWIIFVFCFVGPISIACIALWGFLYVVFIAWSGHLLINQEASRLKILAFMVFPQFACTVLTMGALDNYDTAKVSRLMVVAPLVFLFSVSPYLFAWHRRDKLTQREREP